MISKHAIFICSVGRTGTQFFAQTLGKMIKDSEAYHEPGTIWITKMNKYIKDIKKFGLFSMTLGQILPTHSMYKLSSDRLRGKVDSKRAEKFVFNMRRYVEDIEAKVYIESSGHIYGVLDIIEKVFQNAKFVIVVRDPRTWIVSALQTLEYILYGCCDIPLLKLSMNGTDFPDNKYCQSWYKLSKFEKYCWYYDKINSIILDSIQDKSKIIILKYEDLFYNNRENHFKELLRFSSNFDDGFSTKFKFDEYLLDKKVHSTSHKTKVPHWEEWDSIMAKTLYRHCGRWMKRFNYGNESRWLSKLS